MKKLVFFSFLFVFLFSVTPAIRAQETDNPYPLTSLKNANAELKKALAEKDAPLIVKSIITRSQSLLDISPDSIVPITTQVQQTIEQCTNVPEKALLQSLLAILYANYYTEDEYAIANRPIQNNANSSLLSWDKESFRNKIAELITASLAPEKELINTPASAYKIAFTDGKDSPLLRPTLYDFIGQEAIKICENLTSPIYWKEVAIPADSSMLPADKFIQWADRPLSNDYARNILSIYAKLLKTKDINSPAFLLCDLDRLKYASSFRFGKQYTDRLFSLIPTYENSPYVAEIAIDLCENINYTDSMPLIKKVYDLSMQIIKKYPKYDRIGCLQNYCNTMEGIHVSASYMDTQYPNETIPLTLSYKNANKIMLEIFPTSITEYEKSLSGKKTKFVGNNPIFSQEYNLGDTLTFTSIQRTFNIPGLNLGCYYIKITPNNSEEKQTGGYLFISRLFSFTRTFCQDGLLHVVDAQSGKPVKGANVRFDLSTASDETKKIWLTTDKDGTVALPIQSLEKTRNRYAYRVTYKNDSATVLRTLFPPYYTPSDVKLTTALFSDRSIYRPGNKIYFSGILYTPAQKVTPNTVVEITFTGANNELIAKESFTTDAYGSFSGNFTIPQNGLNGSYQLSCTQTSDNLYVTVLNYVKPSFKIEAEPKKGVYSTEKTIRINGKLETFSGVALPNCKVSYQITQRPRFQFYYPPIESKIVENGTIYSNATGEFAIKFKPVNENLTRIVIYEINITATSSTGETRSKTIAIPVGNVSLDMNISAPEYVDKNSTDPTFEVLLYNGINEPVTQECKYIVYSLYPNTEIDENGLNNLNKQKIYMEVCEGKVLSGSKLQIPNLAKLKSGAYRLLCTTKDANGHLVSEERSFIVYGQNDKNPPLLTTLWVPQTTYDVPVGEIAHITFGTSYTNSYVYYSLYDGCTLIEKKVVRLSNKNHLLNVLYKPTYGDRLYLSVTFVKNAKLYQQKIEIKKQTISKQLNIITETFRDKITPGTPEKWTFKITDSKGQPVTARCMTEMYDKALDVLQPHSWMFTPNEIYSNRYFGSTSSYQMNYMSSPYSSTQSFKCTNFEFFRFPIQVRYNRMFPLMLRGIRYVKANESPQYDLNEVAMVSKKAPASTAGTTSDNAYRQNFAETAFFYPQLTSDKEGNISFSFDVPDVNSEWKFQALAYTPLLQCGMITKDVVSQKQLMVTPNIPSYLRQGDETTIESLVSNLSKNVLQGETYFEIYNPYNDSIIGTQKGTFTLDPGESKTIAFSIVAPSDMSILGIRVKAVSPSYTDGEQHIVPVLTNQVLLTQSYNFTATDREKEQTFSFPEITKPGKGEKNYQFTLEYTANPIWYTIFALPQIKNTTSQSAIDLSQSIFSYKVIDAIGRRYPDLLSAIDNYKAQGENTPIVSPLSKNEALKSILLSETPWLLEAKNENERIANLVNLFDNNENRYQIISKNNTLQDLLQPNGGWSWFQGGQSNRFVTLSVLNALIMGQQIAQIDPTEQDRNQQINALRFLDEDILTESSKQPDIFYLYIRSYFRDIPLTGETLNRHKEWMEALKTSWPNYSIYDKARIGFIMQRYGFATIAQNIVRSLREYSTTTKNVMYWQRNTGGFNMDDMTAINTQCLLINLWSEMGESADEIAAMRVWLLQQKETQSWGSNAATVNAVYTLLNTQPNKKQDVCDGSISWNGKQYKFEKGQPLTGYIQSIVPAQQANAQIGTINMTDNCSNYTTGAIYRQYFTQNENVKDFTSGEIKLAREYYVKKQTRTHSEYVPLNKTRVQVGDKVLVKLKVTANRNLEFVELQDERPACFEPTVQLSQYVGQEGIGYLRENKTSQTLFFFDRLPKGYYEFTYEVYVTRAGEFNCGYSDVQCLYSPNIRSNTSGGYIVTDK